MRAVRSAPTAVIFATGIAVAPTASAQSFDIPAGTLGTVVGNIGAQARITISLGDPDLARRRSPGVRGSYSIRQAIKRALAGTGAEARFYDGALVRIVSSRKSILPSPRRSPSPRAAEPDEPAGEIIVTATKQKSPLDRYPGTVKVVSTDPGWTNRYGADGIAALTKVAPTVSATNLGTGREKIFIRGIADSSFSGPTQATTGQYLGDVRLTYNAPDPALNVYDMERIEVLVGPQAPLYGAGSLGGVIRLVPNLPNVEQFAGSASGNVEATRHGGVSMDGAAMLNVPLETGRWAARVTLSGGRKAGYIDAPTQGRHDINRTRSFGHRIALRGEDILGWAIDTGYVSQSVHNDTGQYTLKNGRDLERDEPVAQPFRSRYELGYFNVSRPIGSADFVSTTSAVHHRLDALTDASALLGSPLTIEQQNDIAIFSHEMRFSGGNARFPWVAGASTIYSHSKVSNILSVPGDEPAKVSVVNRNLDSALYGQVTQPISRTLSATIGARLTYAHTETYLTDPPLTDVEPSLRRSARFTRTIALDWRFDHAASAFFRHDQGYRAGGLTAYPTLLGLASQNFRPDSLDMYEIGVRAGDLEQSSLTLRASIFIARWRNVQADLIDGLGFAYTANVGNGRIDGLDAELRWRPSSSLMVSASAFFNDSRLEETGTRTRRAARQHLPNVARTGARVSMDWHREIAQGIVLSANTAVRYVGESRLGVGPVLNIPQGDYAVADIGARLIHGRYVLSAYVDNLADARGNTFAFGNPYSISRRDQVTPLRPRTLRIGLDLSF